MINDIQKLLDQYVNWLKEKTHLRVVEDFVEITTPYLDRNNDYIQIYAKPENNGYLLTDDGYTIEDLKLSGCDLDSNKRQNLLNTTLQGFGVQIDKNRAIFVKANSLNFSMKKHNFIQAILAINDLFYVAAPIVSSLFYESVANWLDASEIRYTPRVKFTGKSGYDHMFDFVIPKSKTAPERILKAINRPNRDTAESFAFSWIDTKDVRAPDTSAYAILNDMEEQPQINVIEAFKNYDINPILWSERENNKAQLYS